MGYRIANGRLTGGYRVVSIVMLVIMLTISAMASAAQQAVAADIGALSEPQELLIGFEPDSTEAERDAIVAEHGGTTIQQYNDINVRLVRFEPSQQRFSHAQSLDDEPAVRYIEPNIRYQAAAAPPNDPQFGTLWGLDNTGQSDGEQNGTPGVDIDALTAWDTTIGSREIVVGVIDSGINYNHPDLVNNIWSAPAGWSLMGCGEGTHGFSSLEGVSSCDPMDLNGHGTHVAGTIGAEGNNGIGVTGVNWQVSMMGLVMLDDRGSGTNANFLAVLDYAVQAKRAGVNLRVINASFGCLGQISVCYSQATLEQLWVLHSENILFVAAAGNYLNDNDVTPFYPASYQVPNVISVAATDNRDALMSISDYGRTTVHMGAPGTNVNSTVCWPISDQCDTGYQSLTGTSMATPHVAGAAALMLSAPALSNLSVVELRNRLIYCGDQVAALADKTVSGRRLNIAASMAGCEVPTFTLSLDPSTNGSITLSPAGGTYPIWTEVTATAIPDTRYAFTSWTLNGDAAGSDNPLSILMDADKQLAARFVWDPLPSALAVSPATGTYGGTTTLSATLTSDGTPLSGKSVSFSLNGAAVCGTGSLPACPVTSDAGIAQIGDVSLLGFAIGSHLGAVQASFAGDFDYVSSNGSADLSVTQATLTVTADDKQRNIGDPNPALTYTITGYVGGDDASVLTGEPSLSTTATPSSPSGEYPITVTQGTLAAPNYSFTFVPGTLTVELTTQGSLQQLHSLILARDLAFVQERSMLAIVRIALLAESRGMERGVCLSMLQLEIWTRLHHIVRRLSTDDMQAIVGQINQVRQVAGCHGAIG